jgi:drug/metabolite transporter (DMT)-like permease
MQTLPKPHTSPAPRVAQRQRLGIFLVLLSSVAFGSMPIFARLAYAAGAGATTVLFARFGLGALCLIPFAAYRRAPMPHGRTLGRLMALGGVGYVVQSLTMFHALRFASASTVQMVIYTYPAFVAILFAVAFRERVSRRRALAIAVALAGTTLAVGRLGGGQALGVGLALCSSIVYAVYVIAGSRLAGRAGAVAATTIIVTSAAVVLGGIVAIQGPQWPHTALGWTAMAALALVSTVIAALAFLAGTSRVGPVRASTLATVEPMVTLALAALVLGERLAPLQMVGAGLILGAVVTIARK